MTISLTGIIGTRFISLFSRVNIDFGWVEGPLPNYLESSSFFQQVPINFAAADHLGSDREFAHLALGRQVIHEIQHEIFEDHAQSPGAYFALQGQIGNRLERVISK